MRVVTVVTGVTGKTPPGPPFDSSLELVLPCQRYGNHSAKGWPAFGFLDHSTICILHSAFKCGPTLVHSPQFVEISENSCQAVRPSRSPFTLFAHVKNFPVLFFFAAFCTCTSGFA